MNPKRIEPSIEKVSFSCPHCEALAHQTWYAAVGYRIVENGKQVPPVPDAAVALARALSALNPQAGTATAISLLSQVQLGQEVNQSFSGSPAQNLYMSRCYACGKATVWVGERIVYPPARQGASPNEDLPADVLQDYEEARSILDLSPRGAAALLRLCIQKLCRLAGESGLNINDDIASLVRKGLNARVQQALDIVRVIGNESVHPGQIDLKDDRSTAAELFALVNLIADKMVSEPKRIEQIYKGLPAAKLKAISERDKHS